MLERLSVRNFILIDSLDIEFEQGLCVITGETGAGKSILLDAILFCLGYKSPKDIVKHDKDYCSVSAVFSLNDEIKIFLSQNNIESDNELLIKSIQKSGNRKSFFINNQLVNQAILQKLADYLFELHGQNNHTLLLNSSSHIDILDNYGNLFPERTIVKDCFNNWQNITKEINKIKAEEESIAQEIDYLIFVTNELTKLNILPNEEEELVNIRKKLQGRDKEIQLIQDIISNINNPEINQAISKAERLITRSAPDDQRLIEISDHIQVVYQNLEEARAKLQNIINSFDHNEYNLEDIEDRLFSLRGAARKYNISCNEIEEFLKKSQEKLYKLQDTINNASNLEAEQQKQNIQYLELAKILSEKRSKAAKNLEKIVHAELQQLKMEKAEFKIDITPKDTPSSYGIDNIIFTASTNPGMLHAPINKIASGGELSRFMLALKTSLFDKLLKPTIIFDEIDTGIGGVVADKVGERLKKLGTIAQVVVITHQPQVAGKADQHIKVSKMQLDKTTEITIKTLQNEDRQQELARMISGKIITEASLRAAKELMN